MFYLVNYIWFLWSLPKAYPCKPALHHLNWAWFLETVTKWSCTSRQMMLQHLIGLVDALDVCSSKAKRARKTQEVGTKLLTRCFRIGWSQDLRKSFCCPSEVPLSATSAPNLTPPTSVSAGVSAVELRACWNSPRPLAQQCLTLMKDPEKCKALPEWGAGCEMLLKECCSALAALLNFKQYLLWQSMRLPHPECLTLRKRSSARGFLE